MIAMQRHCLTDDEIHSVLARHLPPHELNPAIARLDDCETCRATAESVDLADAPNTDGWGRRHVGGRRKDVIPLNSANRHYY